MPMPEVLQAVLGLRSSATEPVIRRDAIATIEGEDGREAVLAEVRDLYWVGGVANEIAFKATPFADVSTELVYLRNRWYDHSTGSFLSPDSIGYVGGSEAYERAKRTMVNDVATFEAAVARADADGEILYVPGQGFTTITAADRKAADRATMMAAVGTDAVPMMLSPYGMRGQVIRPNELPKEYHHDISVLGRYP